MGMFSMRQITVCLTALATPMDDTLKSLVRSKNYQRETPGIGTAWRKTLIEVKRPPLVLSLVGMTLTEHIADTLE